MKTEFTKERIEMEKHKRWNALKDEISEITRSMNLRLLLTVSNALFVTTASRKELQRTQDNLRKNMIKLFILHTKLRRVHKSLEKKD